MSATVHISAQVIIYKKHDINLGTYPNHTKTQIDKPFNAKTTYNNTLKPQNI
jgi:ABC-type phosphate transport system substrate-binding protein